MSRVSKRWIAAGLMAVLALAAAPLTGAFDAAAQGPRVRRVERPGWGGPMGLGEFRGLDLTDSQRQQLRAIADEHRAEFESIAERLRAAHQAVDEAVAAPVLDESLIRQRVSERAQVEADAAVLRARVHARAWQILTPEQQQKAQELKAQREQRREERRQRMVERRQQRRQQQPQQQPQQPQAAPQPR